MEDKEVSDKEEIANSNKEGFIEFAKILNKKYPVTFNKKALIAKSVIKELQDKLQISFDDLHNFYKWYTGIKYKKRILEGANKYNLKGEIVGTVNKDEFLKIQKLIEQRKNAESLKNSTNTKP